MNISSVYAVLLFRLRLSLFKWLANSVVGFIIPLVLYDKLSSMVHEGERLFVLQGVVLSSLMMVLLKGQGMNIVAERKHNLTYLLYINGVSKGAMVFSYLLESVVYLVLPLLLVLVVSVYDPMVDFPGTMWLLSMIVVCISINSFLLMITTMSNNVATVGVVTYTILLLVMSVFPIMYPSTMLTPKLKSVLDIFPFSSYVSYLEAGWIGLSNWSACLSIAVWTLLFYAIGMHRFKFE